MNNPDTLQIVSLAVAALCFFFTFFQRKSTSEMQTEIALLKKQMSLFWSIVEREIGNMLHSPHRAELDRLIEKNARRERLEPKEVKRFAELLQELADDKEVSHGEQAAAVILKAAVIARHSHDH